LELSERHNPIVAPTTKLIPGSNSKDVYSLPQAEVH